MINVDMLPQYDTKLMTDVWSKATDFVTDYQNIGIPTTISVQNATTLYYLLYARYGNTPIANYDEEQWKYKIFSVVFQYGPTWEKRLDIQNTLRGLQISDLVDNGSFHELFSHSGSETSSKTGSDNNTRTLNTTEKNTGTASVANTGTDTTSSTGTQDVVHTGTSTLANTGTDTTDSTGTQEVVHTGTSEVKNTGTDTTDSTGTQGVTRTGTSSVANTGTDTTASTGTQSVSHTGTVGTTGETEDIKNHAYNPSTAPAQNAYSPLSYINEQHATKNDANSTVTNNLTDTTTNDLENQTTHNTTSTTTNDLSRADTGTIKDDRTITDSANAENTSKNETTTVMTAGKLKAYEKLLELLDTDVTGNFISKFKTCFKQFVMPERHMIYVTEEE